MAAKKTKKDAVDVKKIYTILWAVLAVLVILIGISIYAIVKEDNKETNNNPQEVYAMREKIEALNITKNPVVTIEMENGGKIVAELYPEVAPNTVCNFISLASSGFYDGLIFHRCIEDFMIQGGDPEGTGMGGPGYVIKGEFTNNGFENNLKHTVGVLSMARRSYPLDSAGSQFFIMVADYPYLDGDYATFGKVIEGMDVAMEIVSTEKDENDMPLTPQVMKKVTVDTFGVTYPAPETMAE